MPRYSARLRSYIQNTPHAGILPLPEGSSSVKVGNSAAGELLVIYCQNNPNGSRTACFQATGSMTLIAGGELLCQLLETMSLSELNTIQVDYFLEQLELSSFHRHTAYLLHNALQQALSQLDQ